MPVTGHCVPAVLLQVLSQFHPQGIFHKIAEYVVPVGLQDADREPQFSCGTTLAPASIRDIPEEYPRYNCVVLYSDASAAYPGRVIDASSSSLIVGR